MKQFSSFKNLLLVAAMGSALGVNSQTIHPLAFQGYTTGGGTNNYYADYVGTRLEVTAGPASILGNKLYTASNNGSGNSDQWGGFLTTPIVNDTVVMNAADSFGCSGAFTTNVMGKIALIWRGPISGACEFGAKALAAQVAGAVAVVIINEYPDQGPVGMGAGTSGVSVTIPVYMIGNQDGAAISAAYDAGGVGSVKMTITPWGLGNRNDLGFVPSGYGIWHDFAIPYSQIGTSDAPPVPYRQVDVAFIANYGTNPANGVSVSSSLTFTPNGGSPVAVHSGTVAMTGSFSNSNPSTDSIMAFFGPEYTLNSANVTGPGTFNLTYNIASDSVDQYPYDNSISYSFYATDSLYSKGRYDFTKNLPIVTEWYMPGAENYVWGVPYYVSKGGSAAKSVQVSVASPNTDGTLTEGDEASIVIFKWSDSNNDSVIENGELTIIGSGTHVFASTDSSDAIFNISIDSSDVTGAVNYPVHPLLDSNSWYIVAAVMDVNINSGDLYLGCDGVLDAYPRTFGRYHATGASYREYYNPSYDTILANLQTSALANYVWQMYTSPGADTSGYNYSNNPEYPIDSVNYNQQIGLIPSLPMTVTPYIETYVDNGVKNVRQSNIFDLYPNPASTEINVTLQLANSAKVVSYIVLDGLARIVNSDYHYNVQNDKYTYNTSHLASGNYTMMVRADGKLMFKQFTVVR